jgi:hypothetical protein
VGGCLATAALRGRASVNPQQRHTSYALQSNDSSILCMRQQYLSGCPLVERSNALFACFPHMFHRLATRRWAVTCRCWKRPERSLVGLPIKALFDIPCDPAQRRSASDGRPPGAEERSKQHMAGSHSSLFHRGQVCWCWRNSEDMHF